MCPLSLISKASTYGRKLTKEVASPQDEGREPTLDQVQSQKRNGLLSCVRNKCGELNEVAPAYNPST
jgi:hypothetical protein